MKRFKEFIETVEGAALTGFLAGMTTALLIVKLTIFLNG